MNALLKKYVMCCVLPSLILLTFAATGCGPEKSSQSSSESKSTTKVSAVTGLTVVPDDGQNNLTWTAVDGAVSYNIYWDTQTGVTTARSSLSSQKNDGKTASENYAQTVARTGTRIQGVAGTSYSHTGLQNGVTYYYLVVGVDNDGVEGESPAGGGVAESTPVSSTSSGSSSSSGSTSSDTSSSSSSSSGSTSSSSTSGGSTSSSSSSSSSSSTSGGSTSSSGSSSSGGSSSTPDTTPPVTSDWSAGSATDTQLTCSATINEAGTGYCVAVTSGGAAPTAAQVVAGTGGAIFGIGGSVSLSANTAGDCSVTGLDSNTGYDLYFVAKDSLNNTQTTTSLCSMVTTLAPPTGLAVTVGDSQNTIAWNADPAAANYWIYWSTSPGVTTATGTQINPGLSTSYTHTGLANGTTYYYIVTSSTAFAEGPATLEASGAPQDLTPPATSVWSALAVSQIAMWGSVTIDEDGTGYCVVVPAGTMIPPTPAQVKAGTGGAIVGTGGSVTLTANVNNQCYMPGLTANTAYDSYFVAEDAAGNLQTSVSAFYGVSTAP